MRAYPAWGHPVPPLGNSRLSCLLTWLQHPKSRANVATRLDLTEAAPAFMTIIGMPFTSNIAYGFIGGFITWFICKFFTYQVYLRHKYSKLYFSQRLYAVNSLLQIIMYAMTSDMAACDC